MRKQDNKYIWILLTVCFFSLILFLGNALFNTKGEPREAVVALSMLNEGNFILPINNGVDMALPAMCQSLRRVCLRPCRLSRWSLSASSFMPREVRPGWLFLQPW